MGFAGVHEARRVEERDGDSGQHEELEQPHASLLATQRRQQRTHHQHQPENHADGEQDLPEAAQFHVFIALVAQHERARQLADDGLVGASQRANDDHHQCHKQARHAVPLALGFLGAELGSQVEARGQPAGGDPEDGQLQVPGAGGRVGQDVGEIHTVKPVAFHRVVGRQHTHADLHEEQRHGHGEIERRPALAGGGGSRRNGLGCGEFLRGLAGVVPDHQAHAQDQQDDREDAPEVADGRDAVAHQGLLGPVLGEAVVGTGAAGRGGPGGPQPEVGHALAFLHGGDPAGWNGGALVALHRDLRQLSAGLQVSGSLGIAQGQRARR